MFHTSLVKDADANQKIERLGHLANQVPSGIISGLGSGCKVTVTVSILYVLNEGRVEIRAKKKQETSVS